MAFEHGNKAADKRKSGGREGSTALATPRREWVRGLVRKCDAAAQTGAAAGMNCRASVHETSHHQRKMEPQSNQHCLAAHSAGHRSGKHSARDTEGCGLIGREGTAGGMTAPRGDGRRLAAGHGWQGGRQGISSLNDSSPRARPAPRTRPGPPARQTPAPNGAGYCTWAWAAWLGSPVAAGRHCPGRAQPAQGRGARGDQRRGRGQRALTSRAAPFLIAK